MVNGNTFAAEPAWILVGPPDFAPGIGQVVSLYDTLWDVAGQNPAIAIPPLFMYTQEPLKRLVTFRTARSTYRPEWFADLLPVLTNTVNVKFVFNASGSAPISHSGPTAALTSKAEGGITQFLRPPAGNKLFMFGPQTMPFLYGDDYLVTASDKQALAVTPSQYENFEHWRDGKFDVGAPASGISPEGLDRAALQSCSGGAFFPGMEAGWMIRNPDIYDEPFRLKPIGTTLNPGMTPL